MSELILGVAAAAAFTHMALELADITPRRKRRSTRRAQRTIHQSG